MKSVHRIRKNLTEPRLAFLQHIVMLKKWFISASPEIEKISQNLRPKFRPNIMKNWIINEKLHRIRNNITVAFFRIFRKILYDAEEVIHKRISWNWVDISNSGPKAMPKIIKNWTFNEKVHRIRKTSQKPFFAFLQDITMLKKWFISAFPDIEKISQTLAPKLYQKLWKIEHLMKRCIGSAKPHRSVFSLFLQDITMLKKWFIRAFPEIEKISHNCGPKAIGQKLWKFESFNEKVHRIRKNFTEP